MVRFLLTPAIVFKFLHFSFSPLWVVGGLKCSADYQGAFTCQGSCCWWLIKGTIMAFGGGNADTLVRPDGPGLTRKLPTARVWPVKQFDPARLIEVIKSVIK
jgi:hypothetical protein